MRKNHSKHIDLKKRLLIVAYLRFYSAAFNVSALKDLCRERKLKVGGKKGERLERLEKHDQKSLPQLRQVFHFSDSRTNAS